MDIDLNTTLEFLIPSENRTDLWKVELWKFTAEIVASNSYANGSAPYVKTNGLYPLYSKLLNDRLSMKRYLSSWAAIMNIGVIPTVGEAPFIEELMKLNEAAVGGLIM